ncbi:hypothetical protein ACE1TI_04990 [Alteribacillus sp. JSM 102045]|uniref:hypothetical protein n=1 Tax=Alteribacillus sp. JSM 102045 TaxID=1562101 RepID=UPI0035C14246
MDAETIILDEPNANLDPKSTEDVLQLWTNIASRKNKTLLFIEHKLDHLLSVIDRVIAIVEKAESLQTVLRVKFLKRTPLNLKMKAFGFRTL